MKHFFQLIVLFSVFLSSCTEGEDSTETEQSETDSYHVLVNGTISNGNNSPIFIEKLLLSQKSEFIDSTTINNDGVFQLEVPKGEIGLYRIGLSQNKSTLLLIEPTNNKITLDADLIKFKESLKISGSKQSEIINEYFTLSNPFVLKFKENQDKLQGPLEDSERQNLIYMNEILRKDLQSIGFEYFKRNIGEPGVLLGLRFATTNASNESLELLKKHHSILEQKYPNSIFGLETQGQIQKMEGDVKAANSLPIGEEAPELDFPGLNDESVKLSSLRGKVVLIDFWASWCRPCRAENPHVIKLYNKYKKHGFEIYSFSLDKTKEAWQNAVDADGLIWPNHASDLKFWQTAAIPLYGFNSIPFTVLVDKEGKVIAKKLRGHALESKLKEIFGF